MTRTIVDKDAKTIDAASATVPSDRHFRGAWSLSGTVISEDLSAAKALFKEKIRTARKPLLEALDIDYMKALETSADTTAIVADKQKLRDAPSAAAITNADTIAKLKAAWDTTLLGASPYGD
tara:strand:- start:233 stop:598 length:366 start_codon:yes stop_codon:yes gene_type:complete